MSRTDFWTTREVQMLRELASQGMQAPDIAKIIGRTVEAVRGQASVRGISLKRGRRKGQTDADDAEQEYTLTSDKAEKQCAKLLEAMLRVIDRHANRCRFTREQAMMMLLGGQTVKPIPGTETYYGTASAMRKLAA